VLNYCTNFYINGDMSDSFCTNFNINGDMSDSFMTYSFNFQDGAISILPRRRGSVVRTSVLSTEQLRWQTFPDPCLTYC